LDGGTRRFTLQLYKKEHDYIPSSKRKHSYSQALLNGKLTLVNVNNSKLSYLEVPCFVGHHGQLKRQHAFVAGHHSSSFPSKDNDIKILANMFLAKHFSSSFSSGDSNNRTLISNLYVFISWT